MANPGIRTSRQRSFFAPGKLLAPYEGAGRPGAGGADWVWLPRTSGQRDFLGKTAIFSVMSARRWF